MIMRLLRYLGLAKDEKPARQVADITSEREREKHRRDTERMRARLSQLGIESERPGR